MFSSGLGFVMKVRAERAPTQRPNLSRLNDCDSSGCRDLMDGWVNDTSAVFQRFNRAVTTSSPSNKEVGESGLEPNEMRSCTHTNGFRGRVHV